VPKRREIGQGIVIALTKRDFDVVVRGRTSSVTERSILRSPNASQPMWLPARVFHQKMISPIPVMFPASAMQYSLPSRHIERLVNNAGLSAKSPGDLFDVSAQSYDLNF
jgi:hypothetical protein